MNSLSKLAMVVAFAAPVVVASPSLAQSACSSGGLGYLAGLGSTGCASGDKIYSDFQFSPNWNNTATFGFTDNNDEHTFSGASLGLLPGTYTYSYKVAIVGSNEFLAYRTGAATSSITLPLSSTKTLTGTPNGVTVTATDSSSSSVYTYAPTVAGPVDFTSTINVTAGRLDVITDSLVQQLNNPPSAVPAPFPILGAAAAFGSVRKLRKFSSALKLG
jgi:hypothetical protein